MINDIAENKIEGVVNVSSSITAILNTKYFTGTFVPLIIQVR